MDTLKSLHENISALADGELPDSELELTLAALNDPEARLAWQAYHLVGDVLRGAEARPGLDFAARVAVRLAAEDGAAGAAQAGPVALAQQPPAPAQQAQVQVQAADAAARQTGPGGGALVAPILP
ncbi:sigma-E factor negative regulatory protein [Rugamonas sp. DEMB1]|uniref:sigma-E factor negative regulatory protein n=1 Tax=Rugamonas sp. DEMB1 TaxID=3039386 RepID=UPI00244C5B8A|nr:sigma-E factor negative regulatory protein [Rugamonas sp. DEMB1]WGG52312.1 sigma-E factor negative regulatory protein [Rugamonas sp. DEMB1]